MFKFLIVILWSAFVLGCATHRSYIQPLQLQLERGECLPVLEKLEQESKKEDNDQLLYLMEYASALQICKQYEKSSQVFIQADKLSEQIDYLSLSRATAATLLNEQMLQFKGDKFEKLFINALAALNYLELGQNDSAMVEVRRINEKIKRMADEEKTPYQLNSFAAYLAGLIYETNQNYDDACISYRDSYRIDSSFSAVKKDMLTACWRAQRKSEFKELVKLTEASTEDIAYAQRKLNKNKREITLLFLQGWGPQKTVDSQNMSFARLTPTLSRTKKLAVQLKPEEPVRTTETIYNVEKSAIATLEADLASLAARRFGARIAKKVMADQIRQKDKALGNLALIVMLASERADLRAWGLLPETIQVLRLQLDEAESLDLKGQDFSDLTTEEFDKIDLAQNRNKKIFIVRSLK